MAYRKINNERNLRQTEVPGNLQKNGIGSALVKAVLEDIEQKGLRLIPLCPFATNNI